MYIPEETLNELAYDFLEVYSDDKDKKISPFQFWKRWEEKGYDLPEDMDIHSILDFVQTVARKAREIKEKQDEKN